ncbi:MAG TPA: hypothetical protein VF111_04800, partial [Thermoanaerobaculia bacterium]
AHPRIADIVPRTKNPERVYFRDYLDRARQMVKIWRVLRSEQNLAPLDVYREMERAYRHHLEAIFLGAAGFPSRLREEQPQLTRRFADVLIRMASLRNISSFRRSRALVRDHAVIDLFALLAGRNPRPIYRGNRHHIERKRRTLRLLLEEYRSVRDALARITRPVKVDHAPMTRLYRTPLWKELDAAGMRYKQTDDPKAIRELIRDRIAGSFRNVAEVERALDVRRKVENRPSC